VLITVKIKKMKQTILLFISAICFLSCNKEKESIVVYNKAINTLAVTDSSYFINSIYITAGEPKDSITSFVKFEDDNVGSVHFDSISSYKTKDILGLEFNEILKYEYCDMVVLLESKSSDVVTRKFYTLKVKSTNSSEKIYGIYWDEK